MNDPAQTLSEGAVESHAGLYLTFALADEMYGVEILAVQEIIQMAPITTVPRVAESVRGVINLRGKVIPVVDLRKKFGMESIDDTNQTCIVVVQVEQEGRATTVGIVVDRVAEVQDISAGQIEPPPAFGAAVDTSFILGIGKVGDKVVILLDIHRALCADNIAGTTPVAEVTDAP